jgi:hypothetical protein
MAPSTFELFEKLAYIINSGIGRDKCCRLVQYAVMGFLPALREQGQHYSRLVDRLSKLRTSMS